MVLKIVILTALATIIHSQEILFDARKLRRPVIQTQKLSLAEYPSYNLIEPDGPGTYAYGYEINDPASGNIQFKDEERLRNGTVRGAYGLLQPDGAISITRYVADERGYRQKTETKRDPSLISNYQSIRRPFKPNRRPLRPSHVNQVTVSPEAAMEIIQQHHNLGSSTVYPEVNENEITPDLATAIIQQQTLADAQLQAHAGPQKQVLPGIRPKLPLPHNPNTQFVGLNPNQLQYPINPSTPGPFQATTIRTSPQPIFDRNYSPFDYEYQPGMENPLLQGSPFFQNSKLNNFFRSPYYINNVLPDQGVFGNQQQPPFQVNPFTREALWHKQFLAQQQQGIPNPQLIGQVPIDYVDRF